MGQCEGLGAFEKVDQKKVPIGLGGSRVVALKMSLEHKCWTWCLKRQMGA